MTDVITKDDVRKIAELSNLNLTEDEVNKFARLFTDTLEYMDKLNELDTSEVKETYQVTGLTNVFQEDGEDSLSQDDALSNAKEEVDGHFATEAVFER